MFNYIFYNNIYIYIYIYNFYFNIKNIFKKSVYLRIYNICIYIYMYKFIIVFCKNISVKSDGYFFVAFLAANSISWYIDRKEQTSARTFDAPLFCLRFNTCLHAHFELRGSYRKGSCRYRSIRNAFGEIQFKILIVEVFSCVLWSLVLLKYVPKSWRKWYEILMTIKNLLERH